MIKINPNLQVLEDLMCRKVGDVVEVPGLMGNLSPECVLLTVTLVKEHAVVFKATYHGAYLFYRTLTKSKHGGFKWV